ncbi:hypothetical protein [Nostoc sp.]
MVATDKHVPSTILSQYPGNGFGSSPPIKEISARKSSDVSRTVF